MCIRDSSYVGGTNSVTLEFFTDANCTNKVTTWKQSDGKFKVTRLADGYSKTYTTNAAGEIITDQMPVYVVADATQLYEYKVEEINVPDKYLTPDAQTITLTYGQTAEVRFYNQIARGTLEILKVDHDGVTPLEGARCV